MMLRTTFLKFAFLIITLLLQGLLLNTAAQNPGAGRTYPIEEDFESGTFPPVDWAVYDIDAQGMIWEASTFVNHTPGGTFSAYHGYAPGMQDGWMVTPAMAFPSSGPIILAFYNYTVDPDFYGKNSVLVSTGSGNPADGDFVEIWTPASVNASWENVLLNLADYAGTTAYIAFRYEGDYAHGWAVDDVYIGSDYNTDPQIIVNPTTVNATAPANSPVTKTLTVTNAGVENLIYTTQVTYNGGFSGWLTIDPQGGNLGTSSNQAHTLTFNPEGLALGSYTANILINSNDPETPELNVPVNFTVIEEANVGVTIMVPELTFPYDISESGEYVAISGFGAGGGWLWSETAGLIPVDGEEASIIAVSEDGVIGGNARNPEYQAGGMNVMMSGYWHPQTGEWTFLEINPAAGEPVFSDYTSTWGMTADGSTLVGMQFFDDYSYKAFQWTEAGGYDMIGNLYSGGNRPNGISNDGSVVYGWADLPAASRSPVIWKDGEFIELAPTEFGEAFGASSHGEYVVGYAGANGFIWNEETGVTLFSNTLNAESLNPLAVSDAGTIFGYTVDWPPFPDYRHGFVRLFSGEMMTFNDYAVSRGMADAADWSFLSINAVTPDENKFIGSAMNPDGEYVSFLIDFGAEIPSIVVSPASLTEALYPGTTSVQDLVIQNTGNGALDYETYINFIQANPRVQSVNVPAGKNIRPGRLELKKDRTHGGSPSQAKSRDGFILNYDGPNVDAIGLVDGGTFYNAVRFPADMVAPFYGASISSVDVYINDLPALAMLKFWGPGSTTNPGELLYEQVITPVPYSWNTINLTSPLILDGNDLWTGFTYTHDAGQFVAGIDGGPLNPNGDFISQDGVTWERPSDYGFGSNWNIRAMVQLGQGNWLSLDPASGTVPAESSETLTATFDATALTSGTYMANIIITSNDPENPMLVVPVTLDLLTGISENTQSQIKVFPVPAATILNIETREGIETIRFYNTFGQMVSEYRITNMTGNVLNLTGIQAGVYQLQMVTSNGKMYYRTIVIN